MLLHAIQRSEIRITFPGMMLILALIAGSEAGFGEAIRDEDHDASSVSLEGPGILHLSETHQKLAGIETRIVDAAEYHPESRAFGQVISPVALFELRQQWQTAASERKVAAAQLGAARTAYRQVQDLYNDQAVARLKLEQSRLDRIGAQARYDQAGVKLEAIRLAAVEKWGKVLAGWLMRPENLAFDELIRRKSALLAVSLRPGESLPEGSRTVFVNRGPDRSRARSAQLISSAPSIRDKSQGESYFFQTSADNLRIGMHLYVWIPMTGKAGKAIEIPAEALVWRDGMPWIYRKIASDTFKRYPVKTALDQSDRWFIPEIPDPRAEIVVLGGQTLLSQEFHWQIPDEGDD